MHSSLAPFIGSLLERGLVDLTYIDGDSDEHFNNRLKLQKYVFLARYYDLDMKYRYNRYLRGPYNSGLAHDYYNLAKNRELLTKPNGAIIRNEFFELITNKDIEWLEAASTLLSLKESFRDRKSLLDRTISMKEHISDEKIQSVLEELERLKLISFEQFC